MDDGGRGGIYRKFGGYGGQMDRRGLYGGWVGSDAGK